MKKVLVVAEKPFFIDLLAEHGAVTGLFGVLNAENSSKAIAILESILIDVVVTDLELPEVDGFELLLTVSQRFPNLPIVALTSASQRELRARIESSAALRFHSKPVNLELLINEVCDAMDAVAANQRASSIELGTTLQLLESSRRTCMLRVKVGDAPAGFCFMRDGVLFQAFTPTTKGEEALQQLVRTPGVNLGFARVPEKSIPRGIDLDVTTLLRRAGVLKRFEEDELDALSSNSAAGQGGAVLKTSRFIPVPGEYEEEETYAVSPPQNRRSTDRPGPQTTPKRRLTNSKRSALEQWQESTASRLGPRNMPTQPFMEAEDDDGDDLLEVLGAAPREPQGPGPFVRGRTRADSGKNANVYLPPEDSAVSYDVARGPRPAPKPPSPPPLPKAHAPRMPPRVEILNDDESVLPPALPGVERMTPLELVFDAPLELELPPPPHELGPLEFEIDRLELLDLPPPPVIRNDFSPAVLPPVPLPPVAFDSPERAPGTAVLLPSQPEPVAPTAPAALPRLSPKAQRLIARALSVANDVVGFQGIALVSDRTKLLYSSFGPLNENDEVGTSLPELLGIGAKLCQVISEDEPSCLCIRCQGGRVCFLPLRVLVKQLPQRAAPASLALALFLQPDGETVLAFRRLRQAEMFLVETLQDTQEDALWQALL